MAPKMAIQMILNATPFGIRIPRRRGSLQAGRGKAKWIRGKRANAASPWASLLLSGIVAGWHDPETRFLVRSHHLSRQKRGTAVLGELLRLSNPEYRRPRE